MGESCGVDWEGPVVGWVRHVVCAGGGHGVRWGHHALLIALGWAVGGAAATT